MKLRISMALVALLALIAASCSDSAETVADAVDDATEAAEGAADDAAGESMDDAEEAMDDADEAMAEAVDSAMGEGEQPQRIVSLSPTATELLFAVGAGDQVIAADQYSNYPADAPSDEGLSGFDPNLEAIVAYEPDLVVIANDANDLVAGLEALDIPVLINAAPADIESGYEVMAELGAAVGRVDETAEAIAALRTEMEAALATLPEASGLRIYHELDETYYSASSFGFVGSVYAEMGVENIADAADTDGFGFPQLTEEYIIEADPQLIVITDQVSYTAEDVMARPGWEQVSAAENGNVVVVNADIASRWGPRLPQFVEAVAEAMASVSVDA